MSTTTCNLKPHMCMGSFSLQVVVIVSGGVHVCVCLVGLQHY